MLENLENLDWKHSLLYLHMWRFIEPNHKLLYSFSLV